MLIRYNETMFADRVYETLREVPKGRVTTYKEIARALKTGAYRAVGTALKNNPFAPEVPCHRVVKSDGSIGGFMGKLKGENIEKKIKMLKEEGIEFVGNRVVNFEKVRWGW